MTIYFALFLELPFISYWTKNHNGMQACFEKLFEKSSETLIRDNVNKVYECLCDLFSDFQEALTHFKLKTFDWTLKFIFVVNNFKFSLLLILPFFWLWEYRPLRRSFNAFRWKCNLNFETCNYQPIESYDIYSIEKLLLNAVNSGKVWPLSGSCFNVQPVYPVKYQQFVEKEYQTLSIKYHQ